MTQLHMAKFESLDVWHRVSELTVELHVAAESINTRRAPKLKGQLLCAVAAVGAMIAEGAGQSTDPQFVRYLDMAIASADETENHLRRAQRLRVWSEAQSARFLFEIQGVRRMMYGLRRYLLLAIENAREFGTSSRQRNGRRPPR